MRITVTGRNVLQTEPTIYIYLPHFVQISLHRIAGSSTAISFCENSRICERVNLKAQILLPQPLSNDPYY